MPTIPFPPTSDCPKCGGYSVEEQIRDTVEGAVTFARRCIPCGKRFSWSPVFSFTKELVSR